MAERKPSSYDELFPGRFLKAGLFHGKEVTLRIKDVYLELMPDKKGHIVNAEGERCKKQPILVVETPAGRKLEQEIALNKTNALCIVGMFGKVLSGDGGWVGRLVTFAPRIVDAFGEQVEAIRIVGSPELQADKTISFRVGRADKTVIMKATKPPLQPAPSTPKVQATPAPPPATPPPTVTTGDHEPTDEEIEAAREDIEEGFISGSGPP